MDWLHTFLFTFEPSSELFLNPGSTFVHKEALLPSKMGFVTHPENQTKISTEVNNNT